MSKTEDRRGFFRIDDEINLFYKKITAKLVTEPHQISDNILNSCSLSMALEAISNDASTLLYRLEKTQPDIADYLRLIDTKISLIAQAITMQGLQFKENESRNVNISATGMSFNCEDEGFKQGDYLEIRLLLIASMIAIVSYAKIVYCKTAPISNGPYSCHMGLEFINIKEEDRELLIKYIVKKQMQQIRDKKQAAD